MIRRRSILAASCAAAVFFVAGAPVRALTPYRVADVDPTFRSASSSPGSFYRIGSRALFVARTAAEEAYRLVLEEGIPFREAYARVAARLQSR
ncbi:MAG TPA: hypothetical protein VN851_18970 [Thermoanaerobaculia bacterium]|nr:hypothetical protein [Thermoanaerobaculia bacterium]